MLRRIVAMLLVPILLVPNGVEFRHSHDASVAGHDSSHNHKPHVHFGWLFHHDHDHGQDDDHDRQPQEPIPTPDHDSDAVDVAGPMILQGRDATGLTDHDDFAKNDVLVSMSLFPPPSPTAFVPRPHPPPGACSDACPIYLRTLSLLI